MELWYKLVEGLFPFTWTQYAFMKNALLAVMIITPMLALLGTIVVNNRMAFFSDVLGHSALTGIALGIVFGMADVQVSMVLFMMALAVVINYFKKITGTSFDTVLGVFFAIVVATGIVILSRGGGFAKFTSFLIGDILAVHRKDIVVLMLIFLCVFVYWIFLSNKLVVISVNSVLARSRGIKSFLAETSFAILLALVVACSIRLVGVLIINSLLLLPAAGARNITHTVRGYTLWSIGISVCSGILGLITSYYWGTSSSATIVLFAAMFYAILVGVKSVFKKK
jgi:zinc transport system permease protein